MTSPPEVEAQALPGSGTAYGIPYINIFNVTFSSTATGGAMTVTCETDQACILSMDYYPQDGRLSSAPSNNGTVTDSGALLKHTFTVTFSDARNAGQNFGFRIRKDATDTTALGIRDYIGSLRLAGSRTTGKGNAVPVRFYTFSGPGTGAVPAAGQLGNWSTYTWSQWNAKGN